MIKKITLLIFAPLVILIPIVTFANGGDQRVVEGKYLINLSRAPFTPRVGVNTSMLASFFNIQKNQLIKEGLTVKVRIAILASERKFIYEQGNIKVQGGVLEFPYTFTEPGLHEMFFDFNFTSNPQKVYEAPDFLVDVQPNLEQKPLNKFVVIGALAGLLIGLILGRFIKNS